MDISPNRIQQFSDKAIYAYPSLNAKTTPSTYVALISPGIQTFTVQAPFANANLIIPQSAQTLQYKYTLIVEAKARLIAQDAAADQAAYPIKLIEYGNVQFGNQPIRIDGAPLPASFVGKLNYMQLSQQISQIFIPSIEAFIAFDTNQLTPNTTYTPDPTSTDWFLEMFLSISVKAEF